MDNVKILLAGIVFIITLVGLNCNRQIEPCIVLQAKTVEECQLMKEAIWQLYKHNSINGTAVQEPSTRDQTEERSILEFALLPIRTDTLADTITYYFLFEEGIRPKKSPYFSSVSFWKGEENYIALNWYKRFGFKLNKEDWDIEFMELLSSTSNIDPILEAIYNQKVPAARSMESND